MDAVDHREAAALARAASELLRGTSQWAAVSLHYTAMHVLHGDLAGRTDVPPEERHPDRHKTYTDPNGQKHYGTNDVIRRNYPERVSKAYSSLFSASRAVRYSTPPMGLLSRLWDDLRRIEKFVNQAAA